MTKITDRQQLIDRVMKRFGPALVYEAVVRNGGEVHLDVTPESVPALCVYLNKDLGLPLIAMVGNDEREQTGGYVLYYVFACDQGSFPVLIKAPVPADKPEFSAITPLVPAAHWYEREIRDMLGLEPVGHPDRRRLAHHKDWPGGLYPLRRDFDPQQEVPRRPGEFKFQQVEGDEVTQIPVGPIHAGIIEPGHFRFSAVGETIINLEARLFYTHRGLEKQCAGMPVDKALFVAERICGACSLAHAAAFCQAVEKLAGTEIPEPAKLIRTVALELERLYNHIGDVGNICAGTGFAFGTMHGARLKEDIMQLNETVFGSRFLRGINTPGGVRRNLTAGMSDLIIIVLDRVAEDFREVTEIMLTNDSYLDRVETTGRLAYQTAVDLHAVGPAARASGIDRDSRRDLPYAAYHQVRFKVPVYQEGDVFARIRVRVDEAFESVEIIRQALGLLQEVPGGRETLRVELPPLPAYRAAVGITESARGENVHFLMTGPKNTVYRYMVRSASYCNWPVLPTTAPGNIVPDFPLINKSFELCYSCLDR